MCPYASGEAVSYERDERDERISLRISQLVGFTLHLLKFAATYSSPIQQAFFCSNSEFRKGLLPCKAASKVAMI